MGGPIFIVWVVTKQEFLKESLGLIENKAQFCPLQMKWRKQRRAQHCHFSLLLLVFTVCRNEMVQCKSTSMMPWCHAFNIFVKILNAWERPFIAEECRYRCACARARSRKGSRQIHSKPVEVHGCHGDCVGWRHCEHVECAENESLEISEWI